VALKCCFRRICFALCSRQRGSFAKNCLEGIEFGRKLRILFAQLFERLGDTLVASCGHRLKTLDHDGFKIRKSELV